jgi:hypothetical protein
LESESRIHDRLDTAPLSSVQNVVADRTCLCLVLSKSLGKSKREEEEKKNKKNKKNKILEGIPRVDFEAVNIPSQWPFMWLVM